MSKTLAVIAVGDILCGSITNIYGEYVYSQNYKIYLKTLTNNPGLNPSPPKKGIGIFGLSFGR